MAHNTRHLGQCVFDGCDRDATGRGLCTKHWQWVKRYGILDDYPLFIRKTCEIPGCRMKHYAKGHCQAHYRHARKYGAI